MDGTRVLKPETLFCEHGDREGGGGRGAVETGCTCGECETWRCCGVLKGMVWKGELYLLLVSV